MRDSFTRTSLPRLAAVTVLCALTAVAQEKSASPAPPISAEMFPGCFQGGGCHLAAGFPGVMVFTFKGDPARTREAWLVLDLPVGVELIGAAPWLTTQVVNNTCHWDPEKVVSRWGIKHEGKDHTRYTIALNEDLMRHLRPDRVLWGRSERVYLRTQRQPGVVTAYWKVITRDYETPEQTIRLAILPPLTMPTRKADRFDLMVCKLGQATAPFPEVRDAYFRYWRALHDRPYTLASLGWASLPDDLRGEITRDFRLTVMVCCSGDEPLQRLGEWLVYPPRVMADGSVAKEFLCPSHLIDDPGGQIWEKTVPNLLRLSDLKAIKSPEAIIWDFEPTAMDFCFCDTCRGRFAQFAGLPASPTAQEIKAKYAQKWFDFRVAQHTKINAKFAAMVRKSFPKSKYWICTDNLHDGQRLLSEWCGCDEREFDPDVDLHLPMIYYAGLPFYKDVALNVKSLKKPVFVLVDPAEQLQMFFARYTPPKIKQDIVASAANGAVGIGFWPEDNLDAAYLQSIATGMRLVAEAEEYYFAKRDDALAEVKVEPVFEKTIVEDGKKISLVIPAFGDRLPYTAHEKGANRLITVFNYDEAADAIVRVRVPNLPRGDYWVTDLEAGRVYLDSEGRPLSADAIRDGFLSRIKANDVLLIEVAQNKSIEEGIPQTEFQKALDAGRARLGGGGALSGATQGELVADWGDVEGDGVPEIKLAGPVAKAYISLEKGASVVGWANRKTGEDCLANGRSRGFLGEMVLYDTQGAVAVPWEIKALGIDNGSPSVALRTRLVTNMAAAGADPQGGSPLDGLEVEKGISLVEQGAALKVHLRLTNNSPRRLPMSVGFRVKNYPRLGGAIAQGRTLASISQVLVDTPQGVKEIKADTASNSTVFLLPDLKDHPFLGILSQAKVSPWTPSAITVQAQHGGKARRLRIEPDPKQTAGMYSWWSAADFTVELLSRDLRLGHGESVECDTVARWDLGGVTGQ